MGWPGQARERGKHEAVQREGTLAKVQQEAAQGMAERLQDVHFAWDVGHAAGDRGDEVGAVPNALLRAGDGVPGERQVPKC